MDSQNIVVSKFKKGTRGYLPKTTGRLKLVKTEFAPKNKDCKNQSGIQYGSRSVLSIQKLSKLELAHISLNYQMPWTASLRQAVTPIAILRDEERPRWVGCIKNPYA